MEIIIEKREKHINAISLNRNGFCLLKNINENNAETPKVITCFGEKIERVVMCTRSATCEVERNWRRAVADL